MTGGPSPVASPAAGRDRKLSAEPVTDLRGTDAVRDAALVIMQLALFAEEEGQPVLRTLLAGIAELMAPAEGA